MADQSHIPVHGERNREMDKPRTRLLYKIDSDPEEMSEDEDDAEQETDWGRLLPDIGRVYVFYGRPANVTTMGMNRRPDYTSHEPVILNGPRLASGRFGHALTSLGDVDGDGTEDLAIGCPYCSNRRKDRGAVFIYLGRRTGQIIDQPSQVSLHFVTTIC